MVDVIQRLLPSRRVLSTRGLGLVVASAALLGCGGDGDRGTTFYVSPAGDDAGPGTRQQPFRTVSRAQQAVREVNHAMTADVVVHIASGDYELAAPLAFTDEDSGFNGNRVIYVGDGEPGSARLLGGTRITGWTAVGNGVMAASVPFGFHTLYEDGVRADVARYPDRAAALPMSRAPYLVSVGPSADAIDYAEGELPALAGDLSQLQVVIWSGAGRAWFTDTVPVRAIDTAARQIQLAQATRYPTGSGSRYFLQNAASLVSAPGEFFVDRATRTLYYRPRAPDIDRAEIIAPAMQTIVSIRGASPEQPVHDLSLDGLTLAGGDFTDWYRFGMPDGGFERQIEMEPNRRGLVTLENTERVEIVRSRIADAGYGGIYLLFHNQHDRIYGNLIEHVGINGITVQGGFPGTGDVSRDNVIENNLIRHVGELAGNAAGIDVSNSGFNQIAHDHVHDSPRYGVIVHAIAGVPGEQLYAQGNVVEHVRLERTCQDSGDTAALYTFGLALDGTSPRTNTFRQLVIDGAVAEPSMHDLAPNGVFLDNDSGNQVLEDIAVTNVAAEPYRSNDPLGQTFVNVSWLPGFDAGRLELDAIGLLPDFPSAYLR